MKEPLNQIVLSKEAYTTLPANSLSPCRASPSLVDYDSSDDSEEESTNQRLANSRLTSFHQEAVKKIQDRIGTTLLKLLKHVEAIYNKSLNPLYNSGILFPQTVFP
ncbi:hypothetical protein CB1_000623009 [Camelus ferus]|nr:hypothetical protein CB1_000623009 [Camelus ferus]